MCTKSASRRGVYVQPLHEQAAAGRRGASVSSDRDDSDDEFKFSDVFTDEPPASPKLQTLAPSWEGAALSNDMVSIAQLSPQHQYYYGSAEDGADVMAGASGGNIRSGVIASADQKRQKKRVELRSLMLERRDAEQLPPLLRAGHRMNVEVDQKPIFNSSSSGSSSASSSKSLSVSSSSPQSNLHHGKKSRRWSVKLDFLHINSKASPSKRAIDLRHHIDHGSATTDELGDTIHNDAAVVVDYDQAIFESPRKSTSISISNSAVKRDKKMIKTALSAPVSPAGSPSRAPFSPATGRVGAHSAKEQLSQGPRSTAGLKSPLSPHAQHYQLQRARAEELKRRTSLPYRQPLFGACFFQSPPRHPQVAC